MAGGGRKHLEKIIRQENLTQNIIFEGFVTDKAKLNALYARANLLLFPSIFDNDSLAILEAAQSGTPALVIKNTGSSERIVDGIDGFISENDVEAYADKIYEIISNKSLYQKVAKNVINLKGEDWNTVAKKYIKFFEKVINTK